jgi:hypothetical protein
VPTVRLPLVDDRTPHRCAGPVAGLAASLACAGARKPGMKIELFMLKPRAFDTAVAMDG